MSKVVIRGGWVVDAAAGTEGQRDVWMENGRFIEPERGPAKEIRAEGLIVAPGLVDVHVHLREPGGEDAETIESGLRAALAGGFTTILCMPNTRPPLDTPDMARRVIEQARRLRLARVGVVACATRGREGREPSDVAALAQAGVAGLTDDGAAIPDMALARRVFELARRHGLVVAEHCEDAKLSAGGVMRLGAASRRLNLAGQPAEAESSVVARDLALAEELGARVHLQHLSSACSVDMVRQAKRRGVAVTAEATPHHLILADEDIPSADANYKMNPPLGTPQDREALRQALVDGTVDCVATDHAPHTAAAKAKGFASAPFGVIGMETALAALWTELVVPGRVTALALIERMSAGPARAFGLEAGTLTPGARADVTIFDPKAEWVVDPDKFLSKSRNCPFAGRRLMGKVVRTLVGGDTRFAAEGR